ncbi:CGNR zinc finger domain-containing protein [Mycolicibacterium elephantis]|uniref:CGNR zinc finger domain-containing protein n=1 Tax=Mycolicibacterium elephantis TaxID=81858 RepID=UPI0006296CA8|nr:CGNR zinc finger domain-containing protein [Mycolicibacterium elephantis]KKW65650.1 Zn-ribbon-containing protein [Mycolicibacterium elephantis]OBA81208.1 RNA-binding protein [Mycolicibacterium elephantis]OBB25398.1 RNA-binding protein [Mycolicibacterium elephantis]
MLFSHDTDLTLRAICVLVNSDRVDGDQLADMAALNRYLDRFGWTGRRDHDDEELRAVQRLRERLGKVWAATGDEEQVVSEVNALLSDTRAAPWLTRHPEMPEWHLHLASVSDPLWQRMGAEMAMALADLIRIGELRRLKTCAAPDCEAVLVDLSRNRSGKFCDTGNCGNRQHVAAYRQRRAHAGDGVT